MPLPQSQKGEMKTVGAVLKASHTQRIGRDIEEAAVVVRKLEEMKLWKAPGIVHEGIEETLR